ncbi:MAG: BamA/TamA family outer membrane protein [bacterium]|nr:BamA/TamA family outer membrane protein [bacterium]
MRALVLVCLLLAACRGTGTAAVDTQESALPAFEVVFVGNGFIPDRVLRNVIDLDLEEFALSDFQEAFVDDAAFQIGLHYKGAGCAFVVVEYAVERGAEAPVVTFTIDEGPIVLLTAIDCQAIAAPGDEPVFGPKEHEAFFEGPRIGTFGRGTLLYIEDHVRSAPRRVAEEYRRRGYLDVEVTAAEIDISADRTEASVRVRVRQEQRYDVGEVELTAESVIPAALKERFDTILEAARRDAGGQSHAYNRRVPSELQGALTDLMSGAGYPDNEVRVAPRVVAEESRVHLTVHAQAGIRVTIRGARFEGNETSRQAFLDSRLAFEKDDPYTSEALRRSVERLYATGLFRRVDVQLEDSSAAERDVVITLEEAPSLEAFVEPGYGSYELFRLKTGIRENNLRGSGLQLRAETAIAIRALRAEIGLTDPWFLREDLIGDVKLDFDRREEPSFTSEATGLGAFVTKRWDRQSETTFGYQFRQSKADDVEVVTQEVRDAAEDVNISSVRLTQRLDARDNVFIPTGGTYAELGLELGDAALGSELDFLRTTLSTSAYHQLRQGTVLAAALRGGVIVPRDNEVPIQERFFNGGENSVRSFKESELGPKDREDNPVGGEAFTTFSIELRQNVGRAFQLATFVDTGNVVSDHSDYWDFDDFEVGVGVGLRYVLPVGPVRLDLAHNPNADSGEDDYVLHFAIGMAF